MKNESRRPVTSRKTAAEADDQQLQYSTSWLDGCRAGRRLGEPLTFSTRSTAELASRTRKLADRYRRHGRLTRRDYYVLAITIGELERRGVLAREYRP